MLFPTECPLLKWDCLDTIVDLISEHPCCYRVQNPHSLHFLNIVCCHNWTQCFWTAAQVTFDMNPLWSVMEVLNNFWTDSWCVHWLKTLLSLEENRFSLFYYTVVMFHVETQAEHGENVRSHMSWQMPPIIIIEMIMICSYRADEIKLTSPSWLQGKAQCRSSSNACHVKGICETMICRHIFCQSNFCWKYQHEFLC